MSKKILITSGLGSGDVGGPAQYGENLKDEFERLGYQVRVSKFEKSGPSWIRHLVFMIKLVPNMIWSNFVLCTDTYSVAVPTIILAKLLGKKSVVRIGGDFLWEHYIERTGKKITLKQFNASIPNLNLKEKLIFYFTKFLTRHADHLAFNTEWQKEIWQVTYDISYVKCSVVRNYIPGKSIADTDNGKFLWAGRRIKLKNLGLLEDLKSEFEIEMAPSLSHEKLQKEIKNSHAVILPSYSEVCPNFIIEAISYGKPFIMTQETGLGEIYNKGGIFANPFDKESVKKALLEMNEHYSRYKEESSAFEAVRPWSVVAEEFLSLCH